MASLVLSLGVGALVMAGGLYVWPLTGSGAWLAGDSPFYLAVSYVVEENLRNGRGLWGWSNHDLGGFPLFSSFIPSALGTLVVVALHWTAFMPLAVAYKVITGFSLLFPALSLWWIFARRLDPWVAFTIANLALLLTYNIVEPLNGGWSHYLAVGFFFLLLSLGKSWFGEGPTPGRSLAIVALAAAAALSDASAWIPLLCLGGAIPIFYGVRQSGSMSIVGWIFLLLFPLAVWVSILTVGGGATWGVGPEASYSVGQILLRLPVWFLFSGSGQLIVEDIIPALRGREWAEATLLGGRVILEHLAELVLLVLAIAAARTFLRRGSEMEEPFKSWGRTFLAVASFLLLAMILVPQVPGWSLVEPFRLVPYVNVALLGLAATGLQSAWSKAHSATPRFAVAGLILALALAHSVRYLTYGDHVLLKAADESVVYQELTDAWGFLRSQANGTPTRVLYETPEGLGFLDGGTSFMTALATHGTGIPSLASWKIPTLSRLRHPSLLSQDYPFTRLSSLTQFMRRWNCAYVVVWWPGRREKLHAAGSSEIVHESPNRLFAVLRLRDYEPSWLQFDRPVQRISDEPAAPGDAARFSVYNPWAGNRVVLKIAHHPWWRAWVNGTEVQVTAAGGQIQAGPLPAGPLEISFAYITPWSIRS